MTPSERKKAGYWEDREVRREFLFAFAEKMGFDPLVKDNWKGMKYKLHANKVQNPFPICNRRVDYYFHTRVHASSPDMAIK